MTDDDYCSHPSFAIVKHGEEYTLHCRRCRALVPFYFYTEEEWLELGRPLGSI